MIPLIQREVVERQHWIDEEEFLNMIALAQAAPGIIAVNSAVFVGYRIGTIHRPDSRLYPYLCTAATILGAMLPSFVMILAIAMVFSDFRDNPAVEAVFRGIRPAVVALIAAPLVRMARSARISWLTAMIPVVTALLIWLLDVNPILIIVVAIVLSLLSTNLTNKRKLP